jgi:hypothetical protein
MIQRFFLLACIPMLSVAVLSLNAADPKKDDGFKVLFDGKDLSAFMSAQGKEPGKGWVIEENTLVRKTAGGDIWTKERFGNFILELEFKTTGNSGVFIRTDKPTNNVQTGIEIQVDKPANPGKHSVGAFYDCVAPKKDVTKKDDWNKMVVTASNNLLSVTMNGELVNEIDLDKWTEANKNPDGSKNKFSTALKDFKREGHIGFQDHGAVVMYRNVRVKSMDKSK